MKELKDKLPNIKCISPNPDLNMTIKNLIDKWKFKW